MSGAVPSPRRIAAALAVLAALPAPILADLTARLIDRLDALDGDADAEPDADNDCCPAGDDDPASSRPCVGDPADDEAEPHQEGHHWTPTIGPADCGPVRLP